MPQTQQPASDPPAAPAAVPPTPTEPKHHWARQIGDELFFVFAIVMFFKLFLVDMYKIPTGSMTPTIMGGVIAEPDLNADGKKDFVWFDDSGMGAIQFLAQPDGHYAAPAPPTASASPDEDPRYLPRQLAQDLRMTGKAYGRYDRIVVNKVAYWFKQPKRGQIVVFKVPGSIWKPEAPIYIKRLAGEPGDTLTFDPLGRLIANGQLVESPGFYKTQYYSTRIRFMQQGAEKFEQNVYAPVPREPLTAILREMHVPDKEAYVFGDNTLGSFDSRFWGGVPIENFKGRAFLRIMPLNAFGWLK